jgi:hypothetical protein
LAQRSADAHHDERWLVSRNVGGAKVKTVSRKQLEAEALKVANQSLLRVGSRERAGTAHVRIDEQMAEAFLVGPDLYRGEAWDLEGLVMSSAADTLRALRMSRAS